MTTDEINLYGDRVAKLRNMVPKLIADVRWTVARPPDDLPNSARAEDGGDMLRIALAAAVAPFPAALFQSTIVALWPKEGMGVFERPLSMFVTICLFYYIFGLLIGIPAWLVARRREPVRLRASLIIGLLVGLLPAVALVATMVFQGQATAYAVPYNLAFFGLGGLAAGWTFQAILPRATPPAPDRVFA